MPAISVSVLAGGESRRMGQDKALIPVAGRPAIELVLERVVALSDDVTIITNTPRKYHRFGHRLIGDVYPGKGSLGGIYTAIHSARHSHCLVVACDMPFLNVALLEHLIGLVPGYDVVVPRIEGFPEALHAIYGKACLEPIQRRLVDDQLKIIGFYDDVQVRYVEEDEVRRFAPNLHSFMNMNTPADWERVHRLALRQQ